MIPVYNSVLLYQIVGLNPLWILVSFGSAIPVIGFIFSIVAFYGSILAVISMAKSYSKTETFAIGLVFLPIIFLPMLAFGNNPYIGPNPAKDSVFKNYTSPFAK